MCLPDLAARWRDPIKKPVIDSGVTEQFPKKAALMESVTTVVQPAS